MKTVLKSGLVAAAVLVSGAANAAVADGGFEAQGAAATSGYCYFGLATDGGPACSPNSPWTGTTGSGLQSESNPAWPGVDSPNGSYYGFVQGSGSLTQTLTLTAGSYVLSWLDAGRPRGGANDGNQSYSVTLGLQNLFNGSTVSFQPWGAQTSGVFNVATSGTYTLAFNGQTTTGDHTAFIDAVVLTAVPEPATWAMMIFGFGVVGGAMRRRKASAKLATV